MSTSQATFLRENPGRTLLESGQLRDAEDAGVGDGDVLALVQRQDVDLVAARAQELEHHPDGQRRAPGLKERVRCQHENLHASDSDGKPLRPDLPHHILDFGFLRCVRPAELATCDPGHARNRSLRLGLRRRPDQSRGARCPDRRIGHLVPDRPAHLLLQGAARGLVPRSTRTPPSGSDRWSPQRRPRRRSTTLLRHPACRGVFHAFDRKHTTHAADPPVVQDTRPGRPGRPAARRSSPALSGSSPHWQLDHVGRVELKGRAARPELSREQRRAPREPAPRSACPRPGVPSADSVVVSLLGPGT